MTGWVVKCETEGEAETVCSRKMHHTWTFLCQMAPIYETWLRVCRLSCSTPLTTSLLFYQPGRGESPGNGLLKQLEGVKGSCDSSLGPISHRRALSIPEHLRIVWYLITLIHPLPFSQHHLHDSLTFVVSSRHSSLPPSGTRWDNNERLWILSNYICRICSYRFVTEYSCTDQIPDISSCPSLFLRQWT